MADSDDDWRVTFSVSQLAAQLRREAPADATVKVELSGVGWPFPPS